MEVTVFGFPTSAEHLYNLSHRTSGVWRACDLISKIPFLRRWDEPLWLRGLIKSLRQFDVVHIHNRPQWVRELRQMGYEGTIWLHLQNNHLGHWTAAQLEALAPQLEGVAVCSAFLRGTFADRSPSLAAKTKVIFNGVNTQLFTPREDIREAKTIFFVGRFDEEKVLQLVRAYARLLDRHPDAGLVIGGTSGFGVHRETDYVRKVRDLAQSLVRNQKARIHFPGYIHHDRDLPAWVSTFVQNYAGLLRRVKHAVFDLHHDQCNTKECVRALEDLGFRQAVLRTNSSFFVSLFSRVECRK